MKTQSRFGVTIADQPLVTVNDSNTIDFTASGTSNQTITADVIIDPAVDNITVATVGGVYTKLIDEVTYAELAALISGSDLIQGRQYLITDYRTVHTIPNTVDTNTGTLEPLIVTALSTTDLEPVAYSTTHKDDIVYYDPVNNSKVNGSTKGCIYRRIDTVNNSDIPFDWREVKFRRWQIDVDTVFDIGDTTRSAIEALRTAANPEDAGGSSELDNGNGSLMRILPLVISTMHLPLVKLYEDVKKVSSLTHAHIRSINCCFYYIVFARQLIYGHPGRKAYQLANHLFSHTLQSQNVSQSEMRHLSRILGGAIFTLEQHEIRGSGYVVHSLEASLWCLLTSNSYEEAVLKAINLGEDTDTTGAITGGIAALYFGFESIPTRWINVLARKKDIEVLSNNLCSKYIHPIRLTDIPSPDDMPGALEFSHKYFGYLSTIEETSEVSQEVQRRIEINDTYNLKMVDLGTCLFFYFRMIRHVGDDPDKEWVNTLLGLMKRHIYLLEHANDLISQSSSK